MQDLLFNLSSKCLIITITSPKFYRNFTFRQIHMIGRKKGIQSVKIVTYKFQTSDVLEKKGPAPPKTGAAVRRLFAGSCGAGTKKQPPQAPLRGLFWFAEVCGALRNYSAEAGSCSRRAARSRWSGWVRARSKFSISMAMRGPNSGESCMDSYRFRTDRGILPWHM